VRGATVAPGYDLVVIGTGFASTLFLLAYLRRSPAQRRVLVLERGRRFTHREYVASYDGLINESLRQVDRRKSRKEWAFMSAFGGTSNCWWANTPRMAPDDFTLRTRFGVGQDWPLGYDQLEEYYCQAEDLLHIAGPDEHAICPRSRPFPQPAHRLSDPDRRLQALYPEEFFALPTARPSLPTASRAACCGNGTCIACPVDAKFTVTNELAWVYDDPRVTLLLGTRAEYLERRAGLATAVAYLGPDGEGWARGELFALGANGIFNPHLLLRSGLELPALGRGLVEQVGAYGVAYLDGIENFQGGTTRCGAGYMLHRPETRAERAAGLFLTHNTLDISGLRPARGRWRQIMGFSVVMEDLRQDDNRVELDPGDPARPRLVFTHRSAYADRGLAALPRALEQVLGPMPVDAIELHPAPKPTEAHIIGTTVMGRDPATSVVDPDLRLHGVPNVLVLGSGAFPTAPPANPTLTLSALSLRAVDRLLGSEAA